MAENNKEPLDSLLKRYWCDLIRDLAKTNNTVGRFDCFRDSRELVSKLKVFSDSLVDFVAEVKECYSDAKYHVLRGRRRIEIVKLKLNPRPIKERANLDLSLSINLVTRKSFLFLISKIGLPRGHYVSVAVEDIQNLDVDATLNSIRLWIEKYQEYRQEIEKIVEARRLEALKQKKLAEIASQSIEAIVPQMMAESGYEWNLERDYRHYGSGGVPERYMLRIKTKSHKMIEITLNQKNFAKKIPEILNVVRQFEQLLEQTPFAVNILNYGPGTRWIKGLDYMN